jgi:hypothetical protein
MRAILLVATLLAGLGGCASTPQSAESGEAASGFPELRDVPTGTIANTDPAYWAQAEADLVAAGEQVRAHPRAQPGASEDPAAFIDEARRDLEQARQAHESAPN